ncbi:hypothetical protein ACOCJ7_07130 [Knoellia sp. CPCC 206453]|uniref:hypothetical protein n=1 Tax=Knoellia pratensis TaxID=3404796 RepID=UPI003617CBF7
MTTTQQETPASTNQRTDLQLAVQELEALRERAKRAEGIRDAASLEATQLERSAGADLLDSDDPEAGERMAGRLAQLRASVELQDRVATEAHERARQAEARALRAEGAEGVQPVEEAQRDLERFDAKTERLRAQLEAHTKHQVRLISPGEVAREEAGFGGGSYTFENPPRWAMDEALKSLALRPELAHALADVVAGTRDIRDVHQEYFSPYLGVDIRIPPGYVKAGWSDLPRLVRDGTITIDGLKLRPPSPPRNWQAEYSELARDVAVAEARARGIRERRADPVVHKRNVAMGEDLDGAVYTAEKLGSQMQTLKAEALRDGVEVREDAS